MISREEIRGLVAAYDVRALRIGTLASHSALDVCDGAAEEGFPTVAVCAKGRESPYARYFRTRRDAKGRVERGMVDEALVLDTFKDLLQSKVQAKLRAENVLFVPNRALTSYLGIEAVEEGLHLPIVGSRNLLRTEERTEERGYYWLLEQARLPFPKPYPDPDAIDALVIVKLPHKVKRLERGFFTAASPGEYEEKSGALLRSGVISQQDLAEARIEKYIIGPVFNLDFFYSPLEDGGLELLGIDWRFESSLDGHVRLPAPQQLSLRGEEAIPEYTVVGHNSATLRESLLEEAFRLGEKYVKATQTHQAPGIIGPFTLQTCVDKDMHFFIYDVSPRLGGGTNVHMAVGHPYGNALWRRPMSSGRRLALEVRRAVEAENLEKIVT